MVSEMVSGTVCKRIKTGAIGGKDILPKLNTSIDERMAQLLCCAILSKLI